MREGDEHHLDADEDLLDGHGHVVRGPVAHVREHAEADEAGDDDALPEGEEEDGLDAEELGHGVMRLEGPVEEDVEEPQAVEGVADRGVHDDGLVDPEAVEGERPFPVEPAGVEDERHERAGGLQHDVLHRPELAELEEGPPVGHRAALAEAEGKG